LFFFLPLALLLRVFSHVLKEFIVENKAFPSEPAAVGHDLEISDFEHPSNEVSAEFEFMRFTPENGIGFLHNILRLSAVAQKRQYIGV
jgi:hypothetical protein